MQKILELIALISAVVFVASLIGLIVFYSSQSYQPEQQQYSEQLETKEIKGEAGKSLWQRTTEDPVAFFTFWLVVFTAVLSVVAVLQIKFLTRAENIATAPAEAAKQSANVAERTLTELERPYIFVDIPKFVPSQFEGRPPVVQYILKNHGRTPAIVRWLKAQARVLPMNPQDPPSEDKAPFWMEIFNGQVVFKNGDEKEIQPNVRMPVAFPKSHLPAGPTTVLTIEVTYSDVFDYMHVSEFTYFESNGTFHAIAGKKYNRSKSEKLPEGVEWTPEWSEKRSNP
ncbi:MAG: hypothetical protein ACLP4V_12210 [Methylocella sp.]